MVAFGNIFNNIIVDRLTESGEISQSIRVPISYASRQKFLARVNEVVDDTRTREVVVPRMAFEMNGIEYDPTRKLNIQHINRKLVDSTHSISQYTAVPWNVQMSLYIYTKNQDDGLQIIEQILPFFNPDFNLNIKAMPDLNITNNLNIILNNIEYDDQFEGDFKEPRKIFWTIHFTMKLNFFGPITNQGVIKRVIQTLQVQSNVSNANVIYTATVDPFSAGPDDDYTVIETFDEL